LWFPLTTSPTILDIPRTSPLTIMFITVDTPMRRSSGSAW
jgi:hypothetical protein